MLPPPALKFIPATVKAKKHRADEYHYQDDDNGNFTPANRKDWATSRGEQKQGNEGLAQIHGLDCIIDKKSPGHI
jgi:hypothetical protein